MQYNVIICGIKYKKDVEFKIMFRMIFLLKNATIFCFHHYFTICFVLQVSMKYNVKEVQEEPAFAIDVKVNPIKGNKKLLHGRCLKQQMKVCTR